MDTCHKISDFMKEQDYECRIIGIPKTIDNDLMCIDHTPGYGSAAKYIATTISQVILMRFPILRVELQLLKLWADIQVG